MLIALGTLLLVLIVGSSGSLAHATTADDRFSEEEVSFQSGDVTLHGTVLVPDGEDRHLAIVLAYASAAEAWIRLTRKSVPGVGVAKTLPTILGSKGSR